MIEPSHKEIQKPNGNFPNYQCDVKNKRLFKNHDEPNEKGGCAVLGKIIIAAVVVVAVIVVAVIIKNKRK